MKCIVFDIDGTLFDTKKEIIVALNEVLKSHDIKLIGRNEENSFIGPCCDI